MHHFLGLEGPPPFQRSFRPRSACCGVSLLPTNVKYIAVSYREALYRRLWMSSCLEVAAVPGQPARHDFGQVAGKLNPGDVIDNPEHHQAQQLSALWHGPRPRLQKLCLIGKTPGVGMGERTTSSGEIGVDDASGRLGECFNISGENSLTRGVHVTEETQHSPSALECVGKTRPSARTLTFPRWG